MVYELSDELCPLHVLNETEVEQGREEVTKTGKKALPLWLITPAAVAKV